MKELPLNKIILGDAIEVMKTFPNESIDLVVTSPPYNLGIKYDNWNDNMDWGDYFNWCKEWLSEIYRIMKKDGRVCIVHYLSLGNGNNRQAPLMKINNIAEGIGFKHHGVAIWWDITLSKRTAWGSWLSASSPYINSPFEGILFLYKDQWKKMSEGRTQISKSEFVESCSGIWKISPVRNREHPAPFPEEIASRCIKLLSWENDNVLDPFCGSGTTCVVAKALKRNYIGIDISPTYCQMAEDRLNNGQML